ERRGALRHAWKAILAFAVSSFVLGVGVARLTMVPTAPAMRSATEQTDLLLAETLPQRDVSSKQLVQVVNVRVGDPAQTAQAAASEAVKAGISVSAEKSGATYRL